MPSCVHFVPNIADGGAEGVQPAEFHLDGDLPKGDEAEDELVLPVSEDLDCLAGAAMVGE